MENRFRIKEAVLNKAGTNIWFYPEILVEITIPESGILWWRKPEKKEEVWKNIYSLRNHNNDFDFENKRELTEYEEEHLTGTSFDKYKVIAFRNIELAQNWIKQYSEYLKESQKKFSENYWKYVASTVKEVDNQRVKVHDVKLD